MSADAGGPPHLLSVAFGPARLHSAFVLTALVDTIAFIDAKDGEPGVRIFINGRELLEMVREFELPLASREGHPKLAGEYAYFGPMFVFLPARHFLGEPVNEWTDGEGRIYLLSCTCGFPDCWPLSARVDLRDREVVWSDFRQMHRGPKSAAGEWRYDGFGPFVFDRAQYEHALLREKGQGEQDGAGNSHHAGQ